MKEKCTYADGVGDAVNVGGSDVDGNDQLLTLVVQPLTQRVPAHEELHSIIYRHASNTSRNNMDRDSGSFKSGQGGPRPSPAIRGLAPTNGSPSEIFVGCY